jgi:hypothetical protein
MFLAGFRLRNTGGETCFLAARFPELRRLAGSCEYHTASLGSFQHGT